MSRALEDIFEEATKMCFTSTACFPLLLTSSLKIYFCIHCLLEWQKEWFPQIYLLRHSWACINLSPPVSSAEVTWKVYTVKCQTVRWLPQGFLHQVHSYKILPAVMLIGLISSETALHHSKYSVSAPSLLNLKSTEAGPELLSQLTGARSIPHWVSSHPPSRHSCEAAPQSYTASPSGCFLVL